MLDRFPLSFVAHLALSSPCTPTGLSTIALLVQCVWHQTLDGSFVWWMLIDFSCPQFSLNENMASQRLSGNEHTTNACAKSDGMEAVQFPKSISFTAHDIFHSSSNNWVWGCAYEKLTVTAGCDSRMWQQDETAGWDNYTRRFCHLIGILMILFLAHVASLWMFLLFFEAKNKPAVVCL